MTPSVNISSLSISKPATNAFVSSVTFYFLPQNYAQCTLHLADEDGVVLATHRIDFTVEEMNLWGEDDSYVLHLALQKLGIQI